MKTSTTLLQAALCGLLAFIAFRGLNFDWKAILYAVLLCLAILLALTFIQRAAGKTKEKQVFTDKTVTIVLYEGQTVTGKIRCEPHECGEYVVLYDAEVEDESATVPKGEVYDVIAIPSSVVQMFRVEDLDKVK